MSDFTTDWFTHNIPNWERVLAPLRDAPVSVLEIGSYEGRSALFFLGFLPTCRVTCIDPFNPAGGLVDGYEERFDANTAPFGDRVRKIKGHSVPVLYELNGVGERFDVIYIDGDHNRFPTFADTVLAWPLLKTGGVLIWDDYAWHRDKLPSDQRPEHAIDVFLAMFSSCLTELHRGYQIIIRKNSEWAEPSTPSEERIAAVETGAGDINAEMAAVRWQLSELKAEVASVRQQLPELKAMFMEVRHRPSLDLWRWLKRRLTPPKRIRAVLSGVAQKSP